MKTVGQILKKKRLDLDLSLEEISNRTRIKRFFLKAIEEDNYRVFDSIATVQGFIQNYGQVLGLDTQQLLAVFKRDFGLSPTGKIEWRKEFKPLPLEEKRHLNLSLLAVVIGSCLFVLWYFRWSILPPPLTIYQPKSAMVTNSDHLLVEGHTLVGAKVWVNNLLVLADEKGDFSQSVLLLPGVNQIEVKVSYKNKTRVKKLDVIYHPAGK